MIWRKGAPDDRAGRAEVNGELICDGRVLEVGDALWREQRREDVAILAGLARGERGKRSDRQAEIETDAVDVANADACSGQNEQTVLGQEIPEFVHERENRVRAAIHDGSAADLHDLQPGEEPDWTLVGDRASELAVEQSLARERRGDVLDFVGGVGHCGDSLRSR